MKRSAKPVCFLVCGTPFAYCLYQIYLQLNGMANELGADPAEAIVHFFGKCAMVLLLSSLAITPLWKILGINLVFLRRMIGLFAFFYAFSHVVSYFVFMLEFDIGNLAVEIVERPYITAGMIAFCCLIPLAVTSNRLMQRKLGRNWKRLHRLTYPAAIAVLVHFIWQTRADFAEPVFYGLILSMLLGYRLVGPGRSDWLRGK